MKYFYHLHNSIPLFGRTYTVKNSLYRSCTLYLIRDKGICVIQQYYDPDTKSFWWGAIHPGLANDIYLAKGFPEYFKEHASCKDADGSYFTVEVRSLMWALRMKPLEREWWEIKK